MRPKLVLFLLFIIFFPSTSTWAFSSIPNETLRGSPGLYVIRPAYRFGSPTVDSDPWNLIPKVRVLKITFNMPGPLVIKSETLNGVDIVESVLIDFSTYSSVLFSNVLKKNWITLVLSTIESRKEILASEGLVPDISLPVRLPGKFSRTIGQGGNLKVTGYQRISLGGTSSYSVDAPVTDWNKNSKFPSITMDQELLLKLNGTVGDKVHINVEHNSEVENASQNKVRISYKGDEDEIIQSIIAGDTELSLPSSRFVGISSSHKGLFGIKSEGQIGDLRLTMIASKEKGHSEKGTYLGQATMQETEIYDIEYMHNKFFGLSLTEINDTLSIVVPVGITDLRVYRDNRDYYTYQQTGAVPAEYYYYDGKTPAMADSGRCVMLVDQVDYTYDPFTGLIQLSRSFQFEDQHILAVYYKMEDGEEVGDISSSPLKLKIIHEEQVKPGDRTWFYEMRNRYSIAYGPIMESGFELSIEKISNEAGGEESSPVDESGKTYLELFGLDTNRDGKVDLSYENQYFFDTGILVLPDVDNNPEHSGMPFMSDSLPEVNPAVYNKERSYLHRNLDGKYIIKAKVKKMASTFFLGHSGIIENSEVVKIDGKKLIKNKDYFIIYEIGQVTLVSPPSPTSEVTIDYEYSGLFGMVQKSLFGLRSDYNLGSWGNIGSTLLYETQRTMDDRIKVGDEAGRNLVGDIDFNVESNSSILTKAIDALPLIETDATSNVSFSAEIAGSLPDPNIKRYGYIDDMESSHLSYPLLGTRQNWLLGSVPADSYSPDTSELAITVGNMKWYNPDPGTSESERKSAIYSDLSANESRENLDMMKLVFEPSSAGSGSFSSIQRSLSKYSVDFSQRRYLDLWVKENSGNNCILNIDVGEVSEDNLRRDSKGEFKGRDQLDSEDTNRDGKLQYDEDTGLDNVFTGDPGDDGNDDYFYETGSYFKDDKGVNGTERNNMLDTEDMDADGLLDTKEDFFRFSIKLGDSPFIIDSGSGNYKWKLYRIPLDKADAIGDPDWKRIKQVRIWVTDADTVTSISIHSLEIVGNSWLDRGVRRRGDGFLSIDTDESMEVSVKNLRENSSEYSPPDEIDPGYDLEGNKQNEQSLEISVTNLSEGHEARAVQILYSQQDYTLYEELEYWIHSKYTSSPLFFRMGADSLNYYEIVKTTRPGRWRKINVNLDHLVQIKQLAEAEVEPGAMLDYSDGDSIFIIGRPSLTNIKRLELGIWNPPSGTIAGKGDVGDEPPPSEITDIFWIDDIRLDKIRKEPGMAGRITTDFSLADFAKFTGDIEYVDSEFHGLGSNRGQGYINKDLTLDTQLNMEKLLPPEWGFLIPLRTTYSNSRESPKFSVGSDYRLSGKATKEQETNLAKTRTTLSISKKRKSSGWIGKNTIDRLSLNSEWSQTFNNYYTKSDSSDYHRTKVKYSWAPDNNSSIGIFDLIDLKLLPTGFDMSSEYVDSKTLSNRKELGIVLPESRINQRSRTLNNTANVTLNPFSSFTADFSWLSNRDLLYNWKKLPVSERDTVKVEETQLAGVTIGREVSLTEKANINYSPFSLSWFKPGLGYNATFTEDKRPEIQYIEGYNIRNVKHDSQASLNIEFRPSALFKNNSVVNFSKTRSDKEKDSPIDEENGEDSEINPWLRLINSVPNLLSRMKPIVFSIVENESKDRRNLRNSADWSFRLLGIDDPQVISELDPADLSGSNKLTSSLSTGLKLSNSMNFNISANYSEQEQTQYTSTRNTFKYGWPQLDFSWSSPEKIPVFSKIMNSGNVRSWFKITHEWSTSGNTGIESETRTIEWNPLISFDGKWKNALQTSLTVTKSNKETISYIQGDQRTLDDSWRSSLNMSYTLNTQKGIKLPFREKIWKLDSNTKLHLTFSYSSNRTRTGTVVLIPITNKTTFNIEPSATYSFAKNIEGSARINYGESVDKVNNNSKIRTTGIFFDVKLKF